MNTHHKGDKIRTLATPTHLEVQMVNCTVCRKVKEQAKVEISTGSATIVGSQVIRPSSVTRKVKKRKERERRETAKVGMREKVGQLERDGQTVKVLEHIRQRLGATKTSRNEQFGT